MRERERERTQRAAGIIKEDSIDQRLRLAGDGADNDELGSHVTGWNYTS